MARVTSAIVDKVGGTIGSNRAETHSQSYGAKAKHSHCRPWCDFGDLPNGSHTYKPEDQFIRYHYNESGDDGGALKVIFWSRLLESGIYEIDAEQPLFIMDEKQMLWQFWVPVGTPQPRRQILSRAACGFTAVTQASSTTVYWLKVEVPKKW